MITIKRLLKPLCNRKAQEEVETVKDSISIGKAAVICVLLLTGFIALKSALDEAVKTDQENRKNQNPSISMQIIKNI